MARRGFAKSIGLVLAAVVLIGFVWAALSQPVIGWPSEARRVIHPGGFSIVIPPDWERHLKGGDGSNAHVTLQSLPSKPVGSPGTFNVARLDETPTDARLAAKGYTATTFQDKPAFEKWKTDKIEHEHTRSLMFERDGVWYDVTIRRSNTEPLDRGAWLKYVETFRVEPVRTLPAIRLRTLYTASASQSASKPAP